MAFITAEENITYADEFQQTNLWQVEFQANSAISGGIPDEYVRFRCQTIGMPQQEWTSNEIEINRYKISQPARLIRNCEIDLKFIDAIDAKTEEWFEKLAFALWSQNSNTTTGASLGWMKVKSNILLTMLDSTTKTKTRGYELQHAYFLPQAPEGEFNSEDAVHQMTLKVKANWWKFLPKGVK